MLLLNNPFMVMIMMIGVVILMTRMMMREIWVVVAVFDSLQCIDLLLL